MTTIDHSDAAIQLLGQLLGGDGHDTHELNTRKIARAQVHATLALVSSTEKQTAVLTLIFSAMQTGMTNHQRAELNEAMTA